VRVRIESVGDDARIVFRAASGVVVSMPIERIAGGNVPNAYFNVPDLASITVVGELASVTGVDAEPEADRG
jgi:hypothetical protein